jgi:2-polyprenyl-6-methoxyphenol hydroxylase-like FAD-dependent oxidoreductase
MGWEVPRLLDALRAAGDVYFDSICRVDVAPWCRGRIALVGDAACGATLGGMGTGTAVVAAYVLAGELATADGDHTIAFPRYERLLGAYVRRCQQGGESAGRFLAPASSWAAMVRNALFRRKVFMSMMLRMTERRTTDIDLPEYPVSRRHE